MALAERLKFLSNKQEILKNSAAVIPSAIATNLFQLGIAAYGLSEQHVQEVIRQLPQAELVLLSMIAYVLSQSAAGFAEHRVLEKKGISPSIITNTAYAFSGSETKAVATRLGIAAGELVGATALTFLLQYNPETISGYAAIKTGLLAPFAASLLYINLGGADAVAQAANTMSDKIKNPNISGTLLNAATAVLDVVDPQETGASEFERIEYGNASSHYPIPTNFNQF